MNSHLRVPVIGSETGETTTWPDPRDPLDVEYRLRYGTTSREDRLVAASFIAAYRHLIDCPARVREQRVREIRRALQPSEEVTIEDGERATAVRHPDDHGWIVDDQYLCDGCWVNQPHEHRCHGSDNGPQCRCSACWWICDGCEKLAAPLTEGWEETPHDEAGVSVIWCPDCDPSEGAE